VKTYRYGILGPGRIANSYAKAILNSKNVVVHAVASRDAEKAKTFAKLYNAPTVHNSYEALAKDPDVDVIYIATPHSHHEEHALLCLANGKPVVCEKPLTLDYQRSKRIIDAAIDAKTFLLEGMWSRFNPAVIKAKQLIDQGLIGEVKFVSADFGFSKPYDAGSRLYDLSLGGGSVLDVGVYPLFLALFLLGKPAHIATAAQLAPTGADESCTFVLSYKGGATAQLFSSMIVESKKEAFIGGTKGNITIQTPWYKSMGLVVNVDGQKEQHISLPYTGNGFEFQVAEVNRCLELGLIESPMMDHQFSLLKAQVSDEILRQAGVRYEN
jgi:predicted dehydrogenase